MINTSDTPARRRTFKFRFFTLFLLLLEPRLRFVVIEQSRNKEWIFLWNMIFHRNGIAMSQIVLRLWLSCILLFLSSVLVSSDFFLNPLIFFLFHPKNYYKLSLCVTFSNTLDNLWKSGTYGTWRSCCRVSLVTVRCADNDSEIFLLESLKYFYIWVGGYATGYAISIYKSPIQLKKLEKNRTQSYNWCKCLY